MEELFAKNRAWVKSITNEMPDFFEKLTSQQAPEYLWIGCADSRVPANEIMGLLPGDVFVHRNVANVVVQSDLNCLSVLQFAVDFLKVKHIFVVGHYGCGGVHAAVRNDKLGLIDNWLRHVQDAQHKHYKILGAISDSFARAEKLCEVNVVEQALSVCRTTVVQEAWARGQELSVHGWIYGVHDGYLRDLKMSVAKPDDMYAQYKRAIKSLLKEA
ncbi:MAG: carbonate dehydratase [Porticoccaceae bacterium]